MKRGKRIEIDYSMLSSYLGRSATVLVFAAIILIALGALFLDQDDIAHVSISIGVCAYDSVRSAPALESLADYVRERSGGDIQWIYYGPDREPVGCDFYLMTSLQLAPYLVNGKLDCSLIVAMKEARRYARGVVITRTGGGDFAPGDAKVIFTSPLSATGFLSPYLALRGMGADEPIRAENMDFAGYYPNDERVVFGVLFGTYQAGGISLERLRFLEKRGVVRKDELHVFLEGRSLPEVVLAADGSIDPKKRNGFTERFLVIAERIPDPLQAGLSLIGISGFVQPRQNDLELIRELHDSIPPELIDQIAKQKITHGG